MQRANGESWGALERSYIEETAPHRLENGGCKTGAFLRYAKVQQVPRGPSASGSPIRWALDHHPAFAQIFDSPLFELQHLGDDQEALISFSRNLYFEGRVSPSLLSLSLRKIELAIKIRLAVPLWSRPEHVFRLREASEPDALCMILIAMKADRDSSNSHQYLPICAEWLQSWVKDSEPHEDLVALMLQTLAEWLPMCKALGENNTWKYLRVDLAEPCFAPSPEELQREAFQNSLRESLIAKRQPKS